MRGFPIRTIAPVSITMLVLLTARVLPGAETNPVYKWTDDQGVVHYGDSVPAEYAQRDRSVLNSRGVEVGHVEGHRDAQQAQDEQHRRDAVESKRQHDQFLLTTYASVHEIELLRDERLGQLDGQIKAATQYVETLDTRLKGLTERALAFKPYSNHVEARRMPDDLTEQLARTASERHSQSGALDKRRQEQNDMRTQFDSDIVRYRELTSHRG